MADKILVYDDSKILKDLPFESFIVSYDPPVGLTDYDDLTTPGYYYIPSTVTINAPTSGNFYVDVSKNQAGNRIFQSAFNEAGTQQYFRAYNGTVWSSWTTVPSTAALDSKVTGPASSVSGNLMSFNGITGKLAQDSGVSISTDGTMASNSDAKVSTEKAINTRVNNAYPRQRFFIAHRSSTQTNIGTGNIQLIVNSSLRTITRTDGGSFVRDGFVNNQSVTGAGFANGGNNVSMVLTSITDSSVGVQSGPAIVSETANSASLTSASLVVGNPAKLNVAQYDYSDSLITLNTSTGVITLAQGHVYKFECLWGAVDYSASSGYISICMRNLTDAAYFGYCSLNRPYTDTTNRDILTKMFGVIDTTAGIKEVVPIITQISSFSSLGGGTPSTVNGNGTANVLTIEVIR